MTLKKKVIIAFSALVAVIGLLLLLTYTLFALREVEIDYRTSHSNITATDEEIIESGEIDLGGTVFFRNKKKIEQRIENAHPYIDVINIETVFPSKFVIHVKERAKVYAVAGDGEYYFCDENLRVLEISRELTEASPILLEGDFTAKRMQVGQYIDFVKNPMVYQSLYQSNLTYGNQRDIIEKIRVEKIYDDGIKEEINSVKLFLKGGQTVVFANPEKELDYKAYLFLNVYSNLFDMVGKESVQQDGSKATLTADNLKTCEIYIDNYYMQTENAKENCYFKIFVAN